MTQEERDAIRARCQAARPGHYKQMEIQKMFVNYHRDIPALLDALDDADSRIDAHRRIMSSYESDIDRYKARAEALERAVKEYDVILCDICVYKDDICDNCMNPHSDWRFDEARFANNEPDEPNQQQQ